MRIVDGADIQCTYNTLLVLQYMYMLMYLTASSYSLYLLLEDWRGCRWAPHLVTPAPKSIAAWAYVNRGGGWSFSAMAATPSRAAAVGHERGESDKG